MTQHDDKGATGAGRGQVPNTLSQPGAGGVKVALRRSGQSVEITLTSNTEYASIEMYDMLKQSLENGSLHLDVKFVR